MTQNFEKSFIIEYDLSSILRRASAMVARQFSAHRIQKPLKAEGQVLSPSKHSSHTILTKPSSSPSSVDLFPLLRPQGGSPDRGASFGGTFVLIGRREEKLLWILERPIGEEDLSFPMRKFTHLRRQNCSHDRGASFGATLVFIGRRVAFESLFLAWFDGRGLSYPSCSWQKKIASKVFDAQRKIRTRDLGRWMGE